MFLWTNSRTQKIFGITKEEAETSKALAANQGLYNGFLSAGLFWGLLHPTEIVGHQIQVFFLLCVIIAAIYGGVTAKKSIIIVQGLPALIAFGSLFLV
jgi:putative membrane protein